MPSGVAGVDVMEISRPDGASNIADLGLTLSEAKQLLARVQQAIVAAQAGDLAARRPECPSCRGRCHVNGRRCHLLATPFGTGDNEQLPRFRCVSCGHIERCVTWPPHCRSTPELDRLRAHLSALMPICVAADVLRHLLSADVGMSPETLRAHTLKIGEQLCDMPTTKPVAAAISITVTTDSTFIGSCEEGNRHLEVRVGNVETSFGGRQVFGAVASSDTDIAVQLRRVFEAVGSGRTAATKGDCVHRRLSRPADRFLPTPASPRGRSRTGSTSPCGCSTRSGRQADCSPTNRVARRPRLRSSRRSSGCTGASGTARPKMPRRPSIASARSCISKRVSALIEPEVWHPENCGMRFTRSTNISVARAPGWSTMPLDIALACASGLR